MLYIMDDTNNSGKFKIEGRSSSIGTLAPLPNNISPSEAEFLVKIETVINGETVISFEVDQAAKDIKNDGKNKEKQVAKKYNKLIQETSDKARESLFSLSTEGAMANYLELLLMRTNALEFSLSGIQAELDVFDSFGTKVITKYEVLDTIEKVDQYSSLLLQKALEYAIFRHQKKDKFRADKKVITG